VCPRSRPGWGIADGELRLGVAAPPVEDAATEEARRVLAKALRVAPSRVSLHRGRRSRKKVFAVLGLDAGAARTALETAAGVGSGDLEGLDLVRESSG